MSRSTSHEIKIALLAFAALMMGYAAFGPPPTASSDSATTRASNGQVTSPRNADAILFKRGAISTSNRRDLDTSAEDSLARPGELSASSGSARNQMRVIQFAGPIKRRWVERLRATGAEIVGYIPNNAYIIRGTARALKDAARLDAGEAADDARPIRWMGRYEAIFKIDPAYSDELLAASSAARLDVEIELIDSPDADETIERIGNLASSVNGEPRRFMNFVVLSVTIPAEHLMSIANLDDAVFVGPARRFATEDERSAQIIAANLTPDNTQPSGPGYMAWLAALGLNTEPDFALDVTDTGLDQGSASDFSVHPDFRDADGHSRVAYIRNYTTDGQIDDRRGHGSLVASVAAGLGANDYKDASGYMLGLGIDPMARLGVSRIFDQDGKLAFRLSFTNVLSAAYAAGARITNNSWGNGANSYDAAAQEYDARARDAQPAVEGNQEMVIVFSAGNGGAGGHISSPGTAKNVITVAASENFRPEGTDSCDLDGQGGIGPDGANNALDILRYSAGGPTTDGRAKPDIAAPGTHIYGAASRSSGFFGIGLCPGVGLYQPPGQHLYTWSSGTSLAAPHIAGAASLVRRFFTARDLLGGSRAPSPAMTKAFLINSASYLSGENAGGSLPSQRQGWGIANLSLALSNETRALVDQTKLFTESGQTYQIEGSLADRSRPLRVTLAWTDAPGALAGAALVNDLDLEVTVGGASVYRGNVFDGAASVEGGEADRLNNVESIIIPAGAIPQGLGGNFKIIVRAANVAADGVPGNGNALDQDFALVVSNIAAAILPPPPKKIPVITNATYVSKRIKITGFDFTAAARVEINGKVIERPFEFDSPTNSFNLKLKYKKLNLNKHGVNQIVVIENGERSAVYILQT
ncbi:MAG TPA: S8 family serine peptidase [Blastocatellia bacterium]|nr:S8 family serine peptidase [Blastocatellia bacterium]